MIDRDGTPSKRPLVSARAISHVAIEVSDLENSIAFYEDVFGFEIFQDNRDDGRQPNVKGVVAGLGIELPRPCN